MSSALRMDGGWWPLPAAHFPPVRRAWRRENKEEKLQEDRLTNGLLNGAPMGRTVWSSGHMAPSAFDVLGSDAQNYARTDLRAAATFGCPIPDLSVEFLSGRSTKELAVYQHR